MTGKYAKGLYYLQGTVRQAEANAANETVDHTKKWHARLAHMNIRSMEALARKGYLKREEIKKLEFCEGCAMGKSHKQKFPKGRHTTKETLEYIHTDLWGSPNLVSNLSGALYFLTLTDDISKKVWIYFLKTKDEVFSCFAEWKLMVENQTGKRVKCLRTNNGLEFCNRKMDDLCKESGIRRHKTCSYTPQQNGVSERLNRTIMDKVRSMLVEIGLSESFWAEAASTAVYIINRSPNASIRFEIAEERWSNMRPEYSHLKSFGCVAYVHQVKQKTSPMASKGVFLGYGQGTKGYRVWLIEEQRVVISKDVVFNEEQLFKDIKKEEDSAVQTKETTTVQVQKKKVTFKSNLEELYVGETSNAGGAVGDETRPTNQNKDSQGNTGNIPEEESTGSEGEDEDTESINLDTYVMARDKERRKIRPPSKFEDADEEMHSLEKNHTWDYTERPKDHKVIGCKWLYKYKPGIPGVEKPRHKSRLVAIGYAQTEGIDYNEVFAPVVKHVSIRLLLLAVVQYSLELEQLDVKTAFLHGVLKEIVYMEQPEGYMK